MQVLGLADRLNQLRECVLDPEDLPFAPFETLVVLELEHVSEQVTRSGLITVTTSRYASTACLVTDRLPPG